MSTTAQQKYAALILGGCNSRTHPRSVAVLCTAGVGVIAALDSAPCMTAAKRRANGVGGSGHNRFSVKSNACAGQNFSSFGESQQQ